MGEPRKIRLLRKQCPGDVTVFTAAIKALHISQPGAFLTDYHGYHPSLLENNPYITHLEPWEGQEVDTDYGYACMRSGRPFHFLYGYVENLSKQLGVHIELSDFRGDLYLSDAERELYPGLKPPYIVINAGSKGDITAKQWSNHRFQQVVDALRDRFQIVQIGGASDHHAPLTGVVNLIGQTTIRQLIQIVHRSSLVITGNSFAMHLAAAVPGTETNPDRQKIRPCIVLAGQREQRQWFHYPGHTALGTEGRLPCTFSTDADALPIGPGEACWVNKTVLIPGDRDRNICKSAIQDEKGQWLPQCLHRITARHVIEAAEAYLT